MTFHNEQLIEHGLKKYTGNVNHRAASPLKEILGD